MKGIAYHVNPNGKGGKVGTYVEVDTTNEQMFCMVVRKYIEEQCCFNLVSVTITYENVLDDSKYKKIGDFV
jgi:hypothetical protein